MTEARRSTRSKAIIGARALFNEGRSSVECLIRDISSTGARLSISSMIPLPREFLLEVPSRGQTYKVVLRRRRGEHAGVEFLDQCGLQPDQAEAVFEMTIDELRDEVTNLRQQRAELLARLAKLGHSEWDGVMVRKSGVL
jgi:hypothetical protein